MSAFVAVRRVTTRRGGSASSNLRAAGCVAAPVARYARSSARSPSDRSKHSRCGSRSGASRAAPRAARGRLGCALPARWTDGEAHRSLRRGGACALRWRRSASVRGRGSPSLSLRCPHLVWSRELADFGAKLEDSPWGGARARLSERSYTAVSDEIDSEFATTHRRATKTR